MVNNISLSSITLDDCTAPGGLALDVSLIEEPCSPTLYLPIDEELIEPSEGFNAFVKLALSAGRPFHDETSHRPLFIFLAEGLRAAKTKLKIKYDQDVLWSGGDRRYQGWSGGDRRYQGFADYVIGPSLTDSTLLAA